MLAKFLIVVTSSLDHHIAHPQGHSGGVPCSHCVNAEGLLYRLTQGREPGILHPSVSGL